jgi:hypothetical protein
MLDGPPTVYHTSETIPLTLSIVIYEYGVFGSVYKEWMVTF